MILSRSSVRPLLVSTRDFKLGPSCLTLRVTTRIIKTRAGRGLNQTEPTWFNRTEPNQAKHWFKNNSSTVHLHQARVACASHAGLAPPPSGLVASLAVVIPELRRACPHAISPLQPLEPFEPRQYQPPPTLSTSPTFPLISGDSYYVGGSWNRD